MYGCARKMKISSKALSVNHTRLHAELTANRGDHQHAFIAARLQHGVESTGHRNGLDPLLQSAAL